MLRENLVRLSLKLLGTPLATDGAFYVCSETYRKNVVGLPEDLREHVIHLVESVGAIVPNDFTSVFFFERNGLNLSIEFQDGNTGATATGGRFTSRKSMLSKLRQFDWDECRGKLIEDGAIFEKLTSEAADRPVKIPSSREAAERHSTVLSLMLADPKVVGGAAPFSLIVAREDEPLEAIFHETRTKLVYDIADLLATSYEILAVTENGEQWAFDAIEAAKLEAIDQLGPISRAKAEGRFFV